jgi:hypothetical protein
MAEIEKDVHGFKVKFDDGSETLHGLTHSWEHNMSREDLNEVLHDVRHAPEGKLHMEDGKTTLIHNGDGTYTLRKRNL